MMMHKALVSAMYPLHDEETLKRLSTKWYYSKQQPIGRPARKLASRWLDLGDAPGGRPWALGLR